MPSNVLFMIYLKIRMDQYVLNSLLLLWSDLRTFFDDLRDSCIVWCFVNKLLNFPYLWYLCRILRSEVYVLDFLGVLASLTTWKWHAHNDTHMRSRFPSLDLWSNFSISGISNKEESYHAFRKCPALFFRCKQTMYVSQVAFLFCPPYQACFLSSVLW